MAADHVLGGTVYRDFYDRIDNLIHYEAEVIVSTREEKKIHKPVIPL